MKMKKSLKNKWIKALTSGEYGQTRGTLSDCKGNFCCLGVLEHVVMKGEVEVYPDDCIRDIPSKMFYEYAGIAVGGANIHDDADLARLVELNDDVEEDDEAGEMVHHSTFKDIALWIDKNIKTF